MFNRIELRAIWGEFERMPGLLYGGLDIFTLVNSRVVQDDNSVWWTCR